MLIIEPILIKSFSRFLGSFEPIFDSNFGGNIHVGQMGVDGLPSSGSAMAYFAFENAFPFGGLVVTISLILFG